MPERQPAGGIPEPGPTRTEQLPLRFSFKHLDLEKQKFHPSKCEIEYFVRLFHTLRKFSTWTVEQFTDQNNNEHRHIIWFSDTSEPDGFAHIPNVDSDQFGYEGGWQFAVDHPEKPWLRWRVHGILIDEIFFVVWLDQEHLLFGV
jgi:hypothetical protein